MKRNHLSVAIVAAISALTSCFVTLGVNHFHEPDPVQAQMRAPNGIRIALVNLREVATRTPTFLRLRDEWEIRREAVRKNKQSLQQQVQRLRDELAQAKRANAAKAVILNLKVELSAAQKQVELAESADTQYLDSLKQQYQKDVLKEVMQKVETVANLKGYDVVLQIHNAEDEEVAFLDGNTFADALHDQSLLCAPGVADNSNDYVTDITDAIR